MRKYKIATTLIFTLIIVVVFSGLLFGNAKIVFAVETIRNFDVTVDVNKDSSILVTENIKYDFGDTSRHGIFRDIPVVYPSKLGNISTELFAVNVLVDDVGVPFTVTPKGNDKEIKIGDPNKTISGKHNYQISYRVDGAIAFYKDMDEIYWNMTGNDWPAGIENMNGQIILPAGTDMNAIQKSCYIGVYGSKERCNVKIDGNTVSTISPRILNPHEGITLAVGFPKGIVTPGTKIKNSSAFTNNYIIFLLPVIVLVVMFFIWRKKGKDPKGLSTIMAEYEPPLNMKPTILGYMASGYFNPMIITAGIIYLAEQGFIKIKKTENESFLRGEEYELELVKNDISSLEKTEKEIFNLFFENGSALGSIKKISDISKNLSLSMKMEKMIDSLSKTLIEKGFYKVTTNNKAGGYIVRGMVFAFISTIIFSQIFGPLSAFSSIISGIIIAVFGFLMGKKTKLGAETKDHILGFKMFLSMTEKDRLDFHNAPEKRPEQFMELLPYAIALGIETKWAKQFEGMYITEPNWYHGNSVDKFVALDFASHMSNFSDSFNSSASSGRGSSGGGRGGGGGGSW